jgi:hypothetical protein
VPALIRLGLVAALVLAAACQAGPDHRPSARPDGRATPLGMGTSRRPATDVSTALATAVRVLQQEPADIVLRSIDLPPGFVVSQEYRVVRLDLWTATLAAPQPIAQPTRGVSPAARVRFAAPSTGVHVVLTRSNPAPDAGLVSIASTALRYEVTAVAAQAFSAIVDARPAGREHPLLPSVAEPGDEVRAWRSVLRGATVEQVLLRTRNYLLAVIVVQRPAGASVDTLAYLERMRSRLRAN